MGDYEREILSNLERAETNLQVARELLEKPIMIVSASRAYYADSALLLNQGFDTSKHSGVIVLIHQHFVKSGKLSKEQGRNLNWLSDLRSVGDYGVSLHVLLQDSQRAVKTADIFLKLFFFYIVAMEQRMELAV